MRLTIFSWQEWLYTVCRSVRIEQIDKSSIRSVKCVLRSVNRISLVGLRIFSWQEWVFTVFRSVRTVRTDEKGYTVCEELSSVRKVQEVHLGDYWVPIT